MEWNNFTQNNLNKLKNIKSDYLHKKSLLILKIKQDKQIILNKPEINYTIEETNMNKNILIKYASSLWVCSKVINEFDKLNKEYLIKWNDNKIYIKCMSDKFDIIKQRLSIFLKIINNIKGENTQPILMYLILTSLTKKININSTTIEPTHINSGYTEIKKKYIFIWREEEFEKVVFHELIHLYNYDHKHDEINCNFNNYERLAEAITDCKAIYYNLIYISIITERKMTTLFNLELSFINNQAKMINTLIKNNVQLISPAFSYYVLKSLIFNYLIKQDEMNELNYLNLNCNNNYNNLLNKLPIFNDNTNYINFNSCRMSFFELN